MDNSIILPDLPNSDPESMARNTFNGYYGIGSRHYWKDADVSLSKVQDFKQCSHYFSQEGSRIKCKNCNASYFGVGLQAQDGKLLFNNQVVL